MTEEPTGELSPARRVDYEPGVAVVGSWARDSADDRSDIDLVILTITPPRYIEKAAWLDAALGMRATIVRTRHWRPLTERRARLCSGLEVEFGFVLPSWFKLEPVDPGTARIIRRAAARSSIPTATSPRSSPSDPSLVPCPARAGSTALSNLQRHR